MEMNHIEKVGKRNTILISISVLMVSLHTIYFYNTVVPELESKKMFQQLIRFLLTIGLLVMVYKGKSWARIISIILFSTRIFGAIVGLITIKQLLRCSNSFLSLIKKRWIYLMDKMYLSLLINLRQKKTVWPIWQILNGQTDLVVANAIITNLR